MQRRGDRSCLSLKRPEYRYGLRNNAVGDEPHTDEQEYSPAEEKNEPSGVHRHLGVSEHAAPREDGARRVVSEEMKAQMPGGQTPGWPDHKTRWKVKSRYHVWIGPASQTETLFSGDGRPQQRVEAEILKVSVSPLDAASPTISCAAAA